MKTNTRVIRRLNDQLDQKISVALKGVALSGTDLVVIRRAALEAVAHATDIDAAIAAAVERVGAHA